MRGNEIILVGIGCYRMVRDGKVFYKMASLLQDGLSFTRCQSFMVWYEMV